MSIIKKLIILLLFIIFSIILFRLMEERRAIQMQYGIEGFQEGALFSTPKPADELASLKTTDVPASTIDATNAMLPLKQYCIKGAYNAAITGNYVNADMIKYLFHRGCRFLDFEVFSFDSKPYVAMSNDPTYSTINTLNKDTLQNVLATVATNAFMGTSPVQNDPVFIHLRIKTNQIALYDKIGDTISYVLKEQMYMDSKSGKALPVTGDTILKDIRKKIIVVIDKTYVPTYKEESNLGKYVNMESGGDILRVYGYNILSQQQYTTPNLKDDGITTDVETMKLVTPDLGGWLGLVQNSIYYPMVLNYGAQVVLYPFYQVDMYLGQYEEAFAKNKAAYVPMGAMITYLNKSNTHR